MDELIEEACEIVIEARGVWYRNLRAQFSGAADMRYTKAGRAVEGYEEWRKANDRWLTLLAGKMEGRIA